MLQNRAVRVKLKCTIYTRIDDMLKCLNWMNVKNVLKYNVLNFSTEYNTRGNDNFVVKKTSNASMHRSIFYKGVVEYNRLNADLRRTDLHIFKRLLKNDMLRIAMYLITI